MANKTRTANRDEMAKILFIPVHHRDTPVDRRIDPANEERHARWVLLTVVLGALGLFWVGARLSLREETAGLRELSPEARASLYFRTLDELGSVCRDEAAASGSLHDHCVEQARFVMQFPECTAACQHTAAMVLPHARR